MKTQTCSFLSVLFLILTLTTQYATGKRTEPPKLILQITVDQLRADMPLRFLDRFEKGGFRYLYENGTVYRNAHHGHANTETVVGHATLATGADPAVHGMVGNVWFDHDTGKIVYNVEDPQYPLIGSGAGVDKKNEIDPSQAAAGTDGRSPVTLLSNTFCDELALLTVGHSKIFGVSVKDRGAITMAGHAGKAFWFSKKKGEFISSTYYYKKYSAWVDEWNSQKLAFELGDKSWELMRDKDAYLYGDMDDRPYETDLAGYGRTFPHSFGAADGKYFTTLLTVSPVGDELTADFAKTLMLKEELGQDSIPDYLSISFSSTDYVGHLFGPASLESEDNLLRLDRTLADLFRFVEKEVGLENTLIVFSADHGAAEVPQYLESLGIDAGVFNPEKIDKEPAIEALKKQFGIGKELVVAYHHPYLHLNRKTIRDAGLDKAEVERAVAKELEKFKGIHMALPSIDLKNGDVQNTPLVQSILRNYHPARSGDIYIVFDQHWLINDFDGLKVASTHGSPWAYDTFVPIIFAGHKTPRGENIYTRVETVDIVPTLSAYLRTKPPGGSRGHPLEMVLRDID